MTHKYTPEEQINLFWNKVAFLGASDDECWGWTAHCDKDGYGNKTWNGTTDKAHRVSWMIAYDEIPNGLWVLHKCDNPKCVNPNHLFLGTHQDNENDKWGKNRGKSGEAHKSAKLTNIQVQEIRERYQNGETNKSALGREYGVSHKQIERIVFNKSRNR